MTGKRLLAGALLLCAVVLSAGQAARAAPSPSELKALAERMVREVNRVRAMNGVQPVTLSRRLTEAAQKHSDDMARRNYFDHKAPDGSGVADRVQAAGYPWRVVEENLSAGLSSPVSVVNSWMISPEHRENLLDRQVTDIGVGYARTKEGRSRYEYYWTVVFAAPAR